MSFKSLLSPSSHWRLALQLLINPTALASLASWIGTRTQQKGGSARLRPSYVARSRVGNGSGQWWITAALWDSVNYPLISEISIQFNKQPRSTIG